jgi:hypothetical protein
MLLVIQLVQICRASGALSPCIYSAMPPGFAEGLRHLVTEKQQIREIPKAQRFAGRPTLEKLLGERSLAKVDEIN